MIFENMRGMNDGLLAENTPMTFTTMFSIIAVYLMTVLKVGPEVMSKRAPLDLSKLIKCYNLINIAANLVVCVIGLKFTNFGYISWTCEKLGGKIETQPELERYFVFYLYFYLKIFELLDTVFFVLRKKWRQVSTLHVVHHSVMPILSLAVVRYFPEAQTALTGILNSLIHVFMYSYYYVSSNNGSEKRQDYVPKDIWWKKYITRLQLIQFVILVIHSFWFIVTNHKTNCMNRNEFLIMFFGFSQTVYFLYEFSMFYIKSYSKQSK